MWLDLDLDTKNKWEIVYTLLKTLPYNAEYYISKHGIHVNIPSLPSLLELRMYFGDDPMRVWMDEQRLRDGLNIDVIFDINNGFKHEKTTMWGAVDHVL